MMIQACTWLEWGWVPCFSWGSIREGTASSLLSAKFLPKGHRFCSKVLCTCARQVM
jgi:hypothetical protein